MTIYLLIKPRGASSDQWKIHSRIKKQWRHSREIAENLRREVGNGYVIERKNCYGWEMLDSEKRVKFLPLNFSGVFSEKISNTVPRWKSLKN